MLTQERLKELLNYNPDTGVFIWKISRCSIKCGAVAGSISQEGYTIISVDNRRYGAHRLAWLYVYGKWPENQIDHRNGIRSNNPIINLRDATHQGNGQNRRSAQSNNKLDLLGVGMSVGKFRARITVNGKLIYLGTFETSELAHSAYLDAKRKLHSGCTI